MQQLSRTWEGIKSGFFEKPVSWVLFALLCVTAYQWYAESRRLEDVCGLAREAIGITTPTPDDTEAALKQVEMAERRKRLLTSRTLALATIRWTPDK